MAICGKPKPSGLPQYRGVTMKEWPVQEGHGGTRWCGASAVSVALSLALLQGCVSASVSEDDFRPVGGSPQAASQTAAAVNSLDAAQGKPVQLGSQTPGTAPPATIAQPPPAGEVPASGDLVAGGSDPVARQRAIEEMRAKAQADDGARTVIGPVPESGNQHMSAEKQRSMAEELSRTLDQERATLSDAEIAARQAAIRRLQARGKSHYDSALDDIEN